MPFPFPFFFPRPPPLQSNAIDLRIPSLTPLKSHHILCIFRSTESILTYLGMYCTVLYLIRYLPTCLPAYLPACLFLSTTTIRNHEITCAPCVFTRFQRFIILECPQNNWGKAATHYYSSLLEFPCPFPCPLPFPFPFPGIRLSIGKKSNRLKRSKSHSQPSFKKAEKQKNMPVSQGGGGGGGETGHIASCIAMHPYLVVLLSREQAI